MKWRIPGCGLIRTIPTLAGALAVLVLASAPAAGAQEAEQPSGEPPEAREEPGTSERCRAPEFRHFDFWLGRWEVRNPDGDVVGRNEIRRIAGGCGLLERWRGVDGGEGTSVNTYDTDLGRWTQRWVGGGATLWLEGGLEEGPEGRRMVLAGPEPRSTPRGRTLDRITWTPLPDGRVRQLWEMSSDGGETWEEAFVGLYGRLAPDRDETVVTRMPEDLKWRDAPTGAAFAAVYGRPAEPEPFAFRMRMPPDFRMRPHSHNTAEHVTVLSGTLHMRFSADGRVVTLPPGGAVSIPAEHPMWAWTGPEETIIQVQGRGPFRTTPVPEEDPGPLPFP